MSESNWQPIETAPRDGTPILIYQPEYDDGGEQSQDRHCEGGVAWSGAPDRKRYDDHRYAIGYWRPWGGWGNRNSARVNPTHWMPLPPLPSRVSGNAR